MPADWTMRDVLNDQDGLYTLILENPDGTRDAQVIGSIIDYRYAPDDPESALEVLAAPSTRIISLTITEGGYRDPDGPAFALITEALARRRNRGIPAPTIVSCDNIENNGEVAQRTVLASAERVDPELAEWVAEHARFPNSMVDRITPATTLEMAAEVRRDFGVDDRWPVVAEPFSAWVIEDDFADGRPPLEKAGVLVVDDVRPYELMKLRLLNAGHQCLCYFAHLCGFEFVHDAAQDPLFAKYLLDLLRHRGHPDAAAGARGSTCIEYGRTLIERFANPAVRDTVARLCAYSSDRIPKWLFPVICDNLANDGPVQHGVGGGGQLGPLRRGRRRVGRAVRGARPVGGFARPDRPLAARKSQRVHRDHRGVRRPVPSAPVRRGVPLGAGFVAQQGSSRDIGGIGAMSRGLVIGEALIDIVQDGHQSRRRARRRQPAQRCSRAGPAGPRRRFPHAHRPTTRTAGASPSTSMHLGHTLFREARTPTERRRRG